MLGGGNHFFWLGASAEEADPALVASDQAAARLAPSGFDPLRWSGRLVVRCMGGRHCNHGPRECTADPEYQAFCRRSTGEWCW